MFNILVADDHPIVRLGVKKSLMEKGGYTSVDEAANGKEALDMFRQKEYHAVLLDISMPGMSGLEVLKHIKAEKPEVPVLILTMHPEMQFALRTYKAGADGYLTKDSLQEELIDAVHRIVQGRKHVSPWLAEELVNRLSENTDTPPHETLSDREFQVLCKIAAGMTLTEIAEEFALSIKTISTYRSRILEKMNLKRNAELTLYAIEYQLLDGTL